ncbi:MAG: alginate export family protein [Bacteroidetes bacterium]|nr:alginate export family protein [Bacteroidota bacterium]
MKTKIQKGAVLTAIVASTAIISNAQTTLTGELRPRFEYLHGFGSPADTLQKSAQFILQRTRLNFGYKADKFKTGIVLQDVRVWGNQSQLNLGDGGGTFGLHESWAEYSFNTKISIKLGRQELNYDDERMLGAVNWAQQARSHDAFVLKYADSTFTAHAGVAYNQNATSTTGTLYSIAKSYKEMQYLWLNKQIKSLNVSVLVLNVGQQSPASVHSTRYTTTAGTHIEYKAKPFFAGCNFYYQTGDDMTLSSKKNPKKVNAMNAAFDVAYTMKEKFTIGLGYEYLSGQSQTDTTTAYKDVNHSFNPLFGTNHKFNGYMDYFYVGNHINNVGLQDVIVRLKYKKEKWNIAFDFHQFMTAADVLDTKELTKTGQYTAMNSLLGAEIDLTFGYNLPGGVGIVAGYSHYLASETLGIIKNVKDWKGDGRTDQISNWAYIMIAFKPNFLKQ